MLAKKKAEQARHNLEQGQAFLADNAKQAGVTVLPSGLQYRVLVEGTGAKPSPSDSVVCHYQGQNLKGDIFDSSIARGTPATFRINKLIQGFQEALPMVGVGSKWELFIPSTLAYQDEHKSKEIGANSTLVFELELLEIVA